MKGSLTELTLALAGIFQSAALVQQQARSGRLPEAPLTASIQSILRIDAPDTAAVFGGPGGVRLGLQVLRAQLSQKVQDAEVTRYVVSIIHLERLLRRRRALLKELGAGIERAQRQAEIYGPTHTNVISNLGGLYSETLSRFRFRIMVRGEPVYLENPDNAARVRALLLAGVRAAVLWRQLGGGRLWLLLNRRAILSETERLLADLTDAS